MSGYFLRITVDTPSSFLAPPVRYWCGNSFGHRVSDEVHYFRTQEHGKTWYTVVHGSYQEVGDVRAALRQLPVKLKALVFDEYRN
ncbi:MAG: hypothetical protein CM1200mP41_06910 [Gammaproteobacteria bacterium]|nr:MAG: hypothetical protein CM1200mP41_06910 [Gammaproteobacteria bacterium]